MSNVISPLAQTPVTGGRFGGVDGGVRFRVRGVDGHLSGVGPALSSEIYSVGDGCFARAVVGVTRGSIPGGETPSPEGLVERLDEIRGGEDFVFPSSAVEEIGLAGSLV